MEQFPDFEELNKVSEIEIVYRNTGKIKLTERPQVTSARGAYELFLHFWNKDKIELLEESMVIYLSRANHVLRMMALSSGGLTATVVDARILLVPAIKLPTSAIILAHNHPSGTLVPSTADIELTKKLKSCAALFDINFLDHLIISANGYTSLAEAGFL